MPTFTSTCKRRLATPPTIGEPAPPPPRWAAPQRLIDFVETQPGEHLLDALSQRLDETREAVIDFGLHMTMQPDLHPVNGIARWMSDARLAQMREAYDAGCATFKVYQAYPGMQVRDADLLRVMQHAQRLKCAGVRA